MFIFDNNSSQIKIYRIIGFSFDGRLINLLFIYLLAHGLSLSAAGSVFWDDWTVYRTSTEDIIFRFEQANLPLNISAYLHILFIKAGPWLYKSLALALMFWTGLLAQKIVIRTLVALNWTLPEAINISYTVTLLFLVLPFNMARSLVIIFPYVFNYFLFFLAWALIDRQKIASLILFTLSFTINSLLAFYLVPMVDVYLRNYKTIGIDLRNWFDFLKKRLFFLILPLAYFGIERKWFKPHGIYSGYNEDYDVVKLIKAPILEIANFFDVNLNFGLTLIIFSAFCAMIQNRPLYLPNRPLNVKNWFKLGFMIFLVAGLPYWLLGRVPSFNAWSSRHQLLMPLPFAILLTGILIAQKNKILSSYLLVLFVSTSMSYSTSCYIGYYTDWQKQKQLIELFKTNKDIQDNALFLFDDLSISKNYHSRTYLVHEWNGLLENAFHDQKRLGINVDQLARYLTGDLDWNISPLFKAREYVRDSKGTAVVVTIEDARQDSRELGFKINRSERFVDQLFGWLYPSFKISTKHINISQ